MKYKWLKIKPLKKLDYNFIKHTDNVLCKLHHYSDILKKNMTVVFLLKDGNITKQYGGIYSHRGHVTGFLEYPYSETHLKEDVIKICYWKE